MFYDFEFTNDGCRVMCTRGVRDPATGGAGDTQWWYVTLAGAAPVRLRPSCPGESRGDVWQSALEYLDRLPAPAVLIV